MAPSLQIKQKEGVKFPVSENSGSPLGPICPLAPWSSSCPGFRSPPALSRMFPCRRFLLLEEKWSLIFFVCLFAGNTRRLELGILQSPDSREPAFLL